MEQNNYAKIYEAWLEKATKEARKSGAKSDKEAVLFLQSLTEPAYMGGKDAGDGAGNQRNGNGNS